MWVAHPVLSSSFENGNVVTVCKSRILKEAGGQDRNCKTREGIRVKWKQSLHREGEGDTEKDYHGL